MRGAMHGRPLRERFEAQYVPVPHSGCWLWTGSCDADGYGSIYDGRGKRAHRVAWETENGAIPRGMQVCHKCDTPQCVNPEHLFIGSGLDNMRDKMKKGRHVSVRGSRHPHTKLTAEQIMAIRADQRMQREIAAQYGISRAYVS